MSDGGSRKPVPRPTPETAPFWEGCAAGELRLQHCLECAHVQFPPRRLCTGCLSPRVAWRAASGNGTVRSWSTVVVPGAAGFEAEVPYISVLVKLEEGPTMLSVLRECRNEDVYPGMDVEVLFEPRGEEMKVPYFRPGSGAAKKAGE